MTRIWFFTTTQQQSCRIYIHENHCFHTSFNPYKQDTRIEKIKDLNLTSSIWFFTSTQESGEVRCIKVYIIFLLTHFSDSLNCSISSWEFPTVYNVSPGDFQSSSWQNVGCCLWCIKHVIDVQNNKLVQHSGDFIK